MPSVHMYTHCVRVCLCVRAYVRVCACVQTRCYLLLLCIELKALSEGAGLWLMMLLPVQIHTFSIRNVLLLSVSNTGLQ